MAETLQKNKARQIAFLSLLLPQARKRFGTASAIRSILRQKPSLKDMDSANIRNMLRIFGGDPAGKVHKLMDYTTRSGDVADPCYLKPEYLRGVFNLAGIVMPPLLLDGNVAGMWKNKNGKLEIKCFRSLSQAEKSHIEQAADKLWGDIKAINMLRDDSVFYTADRAEWRSCLLFSFGNSTN